VRPAGTGGLPVRGKVLISEISGSESVVHFDLAGATWVSLSPGVRSHAVGSIVEFGLDVGRAMYFGADGRRISG
jgi:glycerol transport system ATP-binding protein